MYNSFYKFSGMPFQLTPDPDFFYGGRTHNKALAHLSYGLGQGEGVIVVTGDDGTGKSTLIASFLDTLDDEKYVAAVINGSHLAPDTLLQNVAARLGVEFEGLERDEVLGRIQAFLEAAHGAGQQVLIIVDEADHIAASFLDDLQALLQFKVGDDPAVQLVLLGGEELRRRIQAEEELDPLAQRVVATCQLRPFGDAEETQAYIYHRLGRVGWTEDPAFTRDAVDTIHHFCGGIPRRVNQLCSRVLLQGSLETAHRIDEDAVTKVISELVADKDFAAAKAEPATPCSDGSEKIVGIKMRSEKSEDDVVDQNEADDRRAVFDKQSIIATDESENPPETVVVEPVEPAAAEQVEDTSPCETDVPAETAPSLGVAADAQANADEMVVGVMVGELLALDGSLLWHLAVEFLGVDFIADRQRPPSPVAPEQAGAGPLSTAMLLRAAVRELQKMDHDAVRRVLADALGGTLPLPVAESAPDLPVEEAADDEEQVIRLVAGLAERLDKVEKRFKKTEKQLAKTLKALERRQKRRK